MILDDILSFCINNAISGSGDSDQHQITLFALACSIRAKNILELGVRDGKTTSPLLVACLLTGGKVTSVDIQDSGFRPDPVLANKWNFVVQDALEFLKNNDQKFDMVYVDDWHTSEHVYKELKFIDKFATKETIILLHDLMHTDNHPNYNVNVLPKGDEFEGTGPHGGLMKFIAEYPDYEYATIPVNHGLTILRKTK
jgi:predicted O-methyltransferase YrrM